MSKNLANVPIVTEMHFDDYILIVTKGCVRKILFADLIKEVVLGGNSICEAWQNCNEGIGCIDSTTPTEDTPPTMSDIVYNVPNRIKNTPIIWQDFVDEYFDNDGDQLDKIVIEGGDTSGYKLNGNPVNLGDVIRDGDVLVYNTKEQDSAYQGVLYFRAYDHNNIEAI